MREKGRRCGLVCWGLQVRVLGLNVRGVGCSVAPGLWAEVLDQPAGVSEQSAAPSGCGVVLEIGRAEESRGSLEVGRAGGKDGESQGSAEPI